MWTTLGVIGTWQSGGTPSRSNKSYYGGNIPWLKTGDLNDGYITHIPEFITEEAVVNCFNCNVWSDDWQTGYSYIPGNNKPSMLCLY